MKTRTRCHPHSLPRDPELFVGRRDLGDRVIELLRRHPRVRLAGRPRPEDWRRLQRLADDGHIRLGVGRRHNHLVALRGRKGVTP